MSFDGAVILPDAEAVAREGRRCFVEAALAAIRARGVFRVALSGGETPRRTYELLADRAAPSGSFDWRDVHVFFGDERMVPPEHPDSNYRMARESLLSRVAIPAENVHRMHGEAASGAAAARSYENEIAAEFGAGLPHSTADRAGAREEHFAEGESPAFDLVFLGLGADAHVASLFPGTPALRERRRWVCENPGPPPHRVRVTLTFPVLNAAHRVIVLVTGSSKAEAVRNVFRGERDPIRFPAQGLAPREEGVAFLLDREAAAGLTES